MEELKQIVAILTYLSPVFLFIGLLVGLYIYKYLNTVHKWLFMYILIMLFVDFLSRTVEDIGSNLIVLLIYSLIELLFFIGFYSKNLFKKFPFTFLVLGCAGLCYIGIEIYIHIFNIVETVNFQPYSKVVDDFIIILFALGFIYQKINSFKESDWTNFHLNLAIIIYFTLNLLFFLPINFLINETSGLKFYFWLFNLFITLVFYLFLAICIYKNGFSGKKLKPKSI